MKILGTVLNAATSILIGLAFAGMIGDRQGQAIWFLISAVFLMSISLCLKKSLP